jgi:hypothetical protein
LKFLGYLQKILTIHSKFIDMFKKNAAWLLLIPLFYIWGSFLIENKNHHLHYIWTDAEGYYIYLPALFVHGSFKQIPCRDSFMIRYLPPDNKMFTKFTYGTALLESPFFLMGHLSRKLQGLPLNLAYTNDYGVSILFAACFYFVLGIFFIFKTLKRHFNKQIVVYLALISLTIGSNALYYAIRQPGYSHIYSFALVSIFIYYTPLFLQNVTKRNTFYISLLYGFIVLIRPTNASMILFLLLYDCYSMENIFNRFKFWLSHWKKLWIAFLGILLPMIPQMIYWQYLFGKPVTYSYDQAGFDWLHPKTQKVWFDVLNGLFPYTPIMILVVLGMILSTLHRKMNGWLISSLFLGMSYVFGCWCMWWFGGSHGQRSFVEYMPFFSLSMGYLLDFLFKQKLWLKTIGVLMTLFLIYLNIRMVNAHDGGWFGDEWTWKSYFATIGIVLK